MTGARHPRPRHACWALLLGSALALTGCAHSSATPGHRPDSMTKAPEAAPLTAPTTAAEMGRRFLKLVGSIESREELNLELIKRVTGVDIPPAKPDELATGTRSEDLGDGWRYWLEFVPESASLRKGMFLIFLNDVDYTGDMSAICELDPDYYHHALTTMGFTDSRRYGSHGELGNMEYFKGDFVISISSRVGVAGKPGEFGQMCVKSIGTLNGR